jgi:hypothetical protein
VDRAAISQLADAQAMIDELAAHSAELCAVLAETVMALAAVASERTPALDGDGVAPAGDPGPLAADILEIATLQAQAAGVSVEEYLREAVLAYAARPVDGSPGADGDVRRHRARDAARRLRAESEALKAQAHQAAAHAAQVEEHVRATRRRATADGDGDGDGRPRS